MSTVMMHLSRFSEEVIIWNSNEYNFVEIDDAYSTGSSIMRRRRTQILPSWCAEKREEYTAR